MKHKIMPWIEGLLLLIAINAAAVCFTLLVSGSGQAYISIIAGICLGWLVYDHVINRKQS